MTSSMTFLIYPSRGNLEEYQVFEQGPDMLISPHVYRSPVTVSHDGSYVANLDYFS